MPDEDDFLSRVPAASLPPEIRAQIFVTLSGSIDTDRYCKFTEWKQHPVMEWIVRACQPSPKITHMKFRKGLPGWANTNSDWFTFECDVRWFNGRVNIMNWSERENEIFDALQNRGEIVVQVYHPNPPTGMYAPAV